MGLIKIKIDENFDFIVMTARGNSKTSVVFTPYSISYQDKEVISGIYIYDFIELFGTFLSNQLEVNQEYNREHYKSKIARIQNVYSLSFIFTADSKNKLYYSKYAIRALYRKFNAVINKCTFPEMTGYER